MESKRGNLPIIVLVLGILVICTLALVSFLVSDFDIEDSFNGISEVRELNAKIELNSFEGNRVDGLFREKSSSSLFGIIGKEKITFRVEYEGSN